MGYGFFRFSFFFFFFFSVTKKLLIQVLNSLNNAYPRLITQHKHERSHTHNMADVATIPTVSKDEDLDLSSLKKKKKKSKPTASSGDATPEPSAENPDDDLFSGLKKKKKKSKDKTKDSASAAGGASSSAGLDEIEDGVESLNLGPKKKKSSKKKKADSAFDIELEKAGLAANNEEDGASRSVSETPEDVKVGLPYDQLLERFFKILKTNNPELAGERSGVKLKIPPPVVSREAKKTIFSNVKEISLKLQRDPEHVIQYLFAELGTSGSIDGKEQLIIKGKFLQKQLEYLLKKYILEYVTCQTCKSINTKLVRENANRLYFLVCNSCGSSRSVSSIKTGFQAHVGRRKRTG